MFKLFTYAIQALRSQYFPSAQTSAEMDCFHAHGMHASTPTEVQYGRSAAWALVVNIGITRQMYCINQFIWINMIFA